jgi:hypothetical protein
VFRNGYGLARRKANPRAHQARGSAGGDRRAIPCRQTHHSGFSPENPTSEPPGYRIIGLAIASRSSAVVVALSLARQRGWGLETRQRADAGAATRGGASPAPGAVRAVLASPQRPRPCGKSSRNTEDLHPKGHLLAPYSEPQPGVPDSVVPARGAGREAIGARPVARGDTVRGGMRIVRRGRAAALLDTARQLSDDYHAEDARDAQVGSPGSATPLIGQLGAPDASSHRRRGCSLGKSFAREASACRITGSPASRSSSPPQSRVRSRGADVPRVVIRSAVHERSNALFDASRGRIAIGPRLHDRQVLRLPWPGLRIGSNACQRSAR